MSQAASGAEFDPVKDKKAKRSKADVDPAAARAKRQTGPQPTPLEPEPDDDAAAATSSEIPAWLDRAFPWMASILIHLSLFLLIAFIIVAVKGPKPLKTHPIIVPQSMNQLFSLHPGHMSKSASQNPLRQVRQDMKQLMSHHTHMSQTSVKSLLNSSAKHSLGFIARGVQGGTSKGGALATFGVPGSSMGSGPPTAFMGSGGGNATRIVYIIDRGGNLLVGLGQIKSALVRSVDRLVPLQRFGVIVFAQRSQILAPGFAHATNANKRILRRELKNLKPGPPNTNRYRYFAPPFKQAFQLRPEIIYFLANGAIEPKLITLIAKLNKDHATHIYTYAYADHSPKGAGAQLLKKIARLNGGQYKFISRKMVGG